MYVFTKFADNLNTGLEDALLEERRFTGGAEVVERSSLFEREEPVVCRRRFERRLIAESLFSMRDRGCCCCCWGIRVKDDVFETLKDSIVKKKLQVHEQRDGEKRRV